MNEFVKTPPMGWNSWDCYGAAVNEDTVRANAEFMAKHLRQYGWEYIVVDIQWSNPTAKNHEYQQFTELCMDEYSRLIPAVGALPVLRGWKGIRTAGGIRSFTGTEVRHSYHARNPSPGGSPQYRDQGDFQNRP